MQKTLDECKSGLECAVIGGCKGTNKCPYFDCNDHDGRCINDSRKDALAYIRQLESTIQWQQKNNNLLEDAIEKLVSLIPK